MVPLRLCSIRVLGMFALDFPAECELEVRVLGHLNPRLMEVGLVSSFGIWVFRRGGLQDCRIRY